jgi:hypothetical protein
VLRGFALLDDPSRDGQLMAMTEFAEMVIARVDGEEIAAAWLNRQAGLIREEVARKRRRGAG